MFVDIYVERVGVYWSAFSNPHTHTHTLTHTHEAFSENTDLVDRIPLLEITDVQEKTVLNSTDKHFEAASKVA